MLHCNRVGRLRAFAAALTLITVGFCAQSSAAPGELRLSHGRFRDLPVYSPAMTPSSFVLLFSGDRGWDRKARATARALAGAGAMVAGIDLPKLYAALEKDGGQCVSPDGDLENLSHFVQAYAHLPTYLTPLLVGVDSGGAMAYAMLAQAPRDSFGGALSLGFCPRFELHKPLCTKGTLLGFSAGRDLAPARASVGAWIVVGPVLGAACTADVTRSFVAQVPGATAMWLSNAPATAWLPQYRTAFDNIRASGVTKPVPLPPAELGDLPVVEVPAAPGGAESEQFAVILSGDGGWAGLDRGVAEALAARGIPVVGLDSLRYFWSARTPQSLAADMDRIIRHYAAHWHRPHVMLIGYSQGADTLPFALNRLPAATRASVSYAVLLGLSAHALFEFHVSSWLADDESGPATLPEVGRITGVPVLCVYGEDEADSPCPKLDPSRATVLKLAGGHHFDGNFAALAEKILALAYRSPKMLVPASP